MGGEAVQFPTVAVRDHAGSVDGIATDVERARAAAGEVTMDNQAYGILCQFLPGLLSSTFALATSALNGSADALHETAASLRSTADQTEKTDQAGASRISAAGPPGRSAIELPL